MVYIATIERILKCSLLALHIFFPLLHSHCLVTYEGKNTDLQSCLRNCTHIVSIHVHIHSWTEILIYKIWRTLVEQHTEEERKKRTWTILTIFFCFRSLHCFPFSRIESVNSPCCYLYSFVFSCSANVSYSACFAMLAKIQTGHLLFFPVERKWCLVALLDSPIRFI